MGKLFYMLWFFFGCSHSNYKQGMLKLMWVFISTWKVNLQEMWEALNTLIFASHLKMPERFNSKIHVSTSVIWFAVYLPIIISWCILFIILQSILEMVTWRKWSLDDSCPGKPGATWKMDQVYANYTQNYGMFLKLIQIWQKFDIFIPIIPNRVLAVPQIQKS